MVPIPVGPVPARLGLGITLLAAALLAAWSLPVTGNAGGAAGFAEQGCTCHGENWRPGPPPAGSAGEPSPDTTVTLAGDIVTAQAFAWGASYEIQISVASTGVTPTPNPSNVAGFALHASAGTLAPTDDSSAVQGQAISHTAAGNDQDTWTVNWTAPAAGTDLPNGTVILTASANRVNGDALNGFLDHWNQYIVALAAPPPVTQASNNTTAPAGDDNGSSAVSAMLAGAALLAVAWTGRRRRGA